MLAYLAHHEVQVSAVTVMEHVRGYSLFFCGGVPGRAGGNTSKRRAARTSQTSGTCGQSMARSQ
jgi:hypothetical protein